MRLIAIADTHLGFEIGRTANARKFVYDSMFNAFTEPLKIARKEKVDFVLHGGDIFNRSNPRKKVLTKAYQIIEDLLLGGIGFLVAPGNHERSNLPETLLSFHNLCKFFTSMGTIEFDNCTITGFPFSKDSPGAISNKLNTQIEKFSNKKPNLVLCHQLFEGCEFGPHRFRFTERQGALRLTDLSKDIDLIVTGHIHKAQKLGADLVIYPGSTERTSFVEIIEPKGYLMINIEDRYISVEFRELPSIPMSVYEFNIIDKEIDYELLNSKIESGLHRTLIRFTGRLLENNELTNLYNRYLAEQYPLLSFEPKFSTQALRPVYNVKIPFEKPNIYKNIS